MTLLHAKLNAVLEEALDRQTPGTTAIISGDHQRRMLAWDTIARRAARRGCRVNSTAMSITTPESSGLLFVTAAEALQRLRGLRIVCTVRLS